MQSTVLTFKEAAKSLPELTGQRAVDQETVRRWVVCGVRGQMGQQIKLAATRIGGRRYTTIEAVKAFAKACNGGTEPQIPPRRSPSLTMAERRKRVKQLYGPEKKVHCVRPQSGDAGIV